MIPPEIVFLTPHLLERATRPVVAAPEVAGARSAFRALLGALRIARVPLVAALLVAALTWGTPGAAVALTVAALLVLLGFALRGGAAAPAGASGRSAPPASRPA
ncbi:MAG: hypothetical protein ACJ8AO_13395 [Gemmatimonadaceae bacterium]